MEGLPLYSLSLYTPFEDALELDNRFLLQSPFLLKRQSILLFFLTEVYKDGKPADTNEFEVVNIVGNICESGDIMGKERNLPKIDEGDIIGVMDAGAYGYSMASNYNNRLRPAEVLIQLDGTPRLIRRRDTLEDLIRNFEV